VLRAKMLFVFVAKLFEHKGPIQEDTWVESFEGGVNARKICSQVRSGIVNELIYKGWVRMTDIILSNCSS
jgi:hypothetical protein